MTPYKLTDEKIQFNFKTLYRIELTEDCIWGKAGTKGGFIEKVSNLLDDAWVSGNAHVYGNAYVSGNAWVLGNAQVYGNAHVSGNAQVFDNAWVSGNAHVSGNAQVFDNAWVSGNAHVYGKSEVSGNAQVLGNAQVFGNALVSGMVVICGEAKVEKTSDYMTISSLGNTNRTITITFSDKMISAGCFRGTLQQFKTAVDEKYNGKGNYYPTIQYIETLFNM